VYSLRVVFVSLFASFFSFPSAKTYTLNKSFSKIFRKRRKQQLVIISTRVIHARRSTNQSTVDDEQ